MKKAQRHEIIKELLMQNTIRTQEELLQLLKMKGINATQATISRDLNDLQIVKITNEAGEKQFALFNEEDNRSEDEDNHHFQQMIHEMVTKVDRVQFMTIVHTLADNAQMISALIDEMDLPEKVATLAGFDTLVIISKDEADAQKITDLLQSYLF